MYARYLYPSQSRVVMSVVKIELSKCLLASKSEQEQYPTSIRIYLIWNCEMRNKTKPFYGSFFSHYCKQDITVKYSF